MKRNASKLETSLKKIGELSSGDRKQEFKWLIQHFSKENLINCFHELDGKKAIGIDGISKEEYELNLEENIDSLLQRMKRLDYYPAPVKGVKIPKGNGKYRPLGISTIEDKIVQSMFAKILNAIYEPLFINESYGFREKRSCHDAIRSLQNYWSRRQGDVAIDVDLSNFFGTINHRKLIQLLEIKIKDRIFLRYIVRMLKAGVLTDGELSKSDTGSPQGSIVSPVLSNIFAHYAIDIWITEVVPKYTTGPAHFVRYADDFVICTNKRDAGRILKALKGRLERFSLQLNEDKTKVISFSHMESSKGVKQGVIDFLGFTLYWGKSKRGKLIPKVQTNSRSFTKKLKEFNEWCRKNRNVLRFNDFWDTVIAKARGHIQYYGVSFNLQRVGSFLYRMLHIAFKWLNRRSQRKSFNWDKFNLYLQRRPLPKVKLAHRLY